MNLINLRNITCLRKREVSVEMISGCNVIETLAKHGYNVCHASNLMSS